MPDLTPLEYRVLEECAGMKGRYIFHGAKTWAMLRLVELDLVDTRLTYTGPVSSLTPAGRKALEERNGK